MNVVIENASTDEQLKEVGRLRRLVFAEEWRLPLERVQPIDDGKAWHFIARKEADGSAIGVMTVLDTTGQESLHRECELHVPGSLRVARYTQLAVLKGFRGLGIPLRLMLEAREQVIRPGKFDLTWLLYAARYTENCSFRVVLGYQVQPGIIATPRGPCHLLLSPETSSALSRGMAA